jgi:hypothetical protein
MLSLALGFFRRLRLAGVIRDTARMSASDRPEASAPMIGIHAFGGGLPSLLLEVRKLLVQVFRMLAGELRIDGNGAVAVSAVAGAAQPGCSYCFPGRQDPLWVRLFFGSQRRWPKRKSETGRNRAI